MNVFCIFKHIHVLNIKFLLWTTLTCNIYQLIIDRNDYFPIVGGCFCAGYDLKALSETPDGADVGKSHQDLLAPDQWRPMVVYTQYHMFLVF